MEKTAAHQPYERSRILYVSGASRRHLPKRTDAPLAILSAQDLYSPLINPPENHEHFASSSAFPTRIVRAFHGALWDRESKCLFDAITNGLTSKFRG